MKYRIRYYYIDTPTTTWKGMRTFIDKEEAINVAKDCIKIAFHPGEVNFRIETEEV